MSDVEKMIQERSAVSPGFETLVDQELAGTSTRAFWTDPADGNLYVFVVMTKDTMDRAMAGAAQAQIKKEIAQGEQSLDKALDKLDAAIAASANPA